VAPLLLRPGRRIPVTASLRPGPLRGAPPPPQLDQCQGIKPPHPPAMGRGCRWAVSRLAVGIHAGQCPTEMRSCCKLCRIRTGGKPEKHPTRNGSRTITVANPSLIRLSHLCFSRWPCVATAKLHSQGGGVADLDGGGLLRWSGGRRGRWPTVGGRPGEMANANSRARVPRLILAVRMRLQVTEVLTTS